MTRQESRIERAPKVVSLSHGCRHMGRCSLAFVLFWCLPGLSQVSPAAARVDVIQYFVTVDQPAYAGEPIWIHTEPSARVHYPFRTGIGDFGCNRLELMRAGKLIPARRLELWDDQNGALCGWVAPPKAPAGRLPLHIWFPSLRPGKYAVRWISQTPDFSNHKLHFSNGKLQMIEVASEWTTFPVRMAPPGQRERWLSDLLAHVPPDPGMLAGDYIPNLAAAAPDLRALRAVAEQLYSENQVVARLAASALEAFPQSQVNALLPQLFHADGPSDVLASLVCADPLRQHRAEFVADSIRFLASSKPERLAAAIETLGFLTHDPADRNIFPADQATADASVLKVAPTVISSSSSEATRQLALYLGRLKGPEAHELLWQIASSGGPLSRASPYCADLESDAGRFAAFGCAAPPARRS